MKGFPAATSFAVVIFGFAVAQYQTNSAQNLLQKVINTLNSYSVSKPGPGSAAGIFAQGCRWRVAPRRKTAAGPSQGFWDVRHYEYWNESTQKWSSEQPDACRIQPLLFKSSLSRNNKDNDTPSTKRRCVRDEYCVFKNLWYNGGKFYYLTDDKDGMDSIPMTRDITLYPLVIHNVSLFPSQVNSRIVPDSTVLIDFLYFIHPTAIGHWLEHLMPLVSAIREEQEQKQERLQQQPTMSFPPDRILLLHLKRTHLIEWVRAVLAAAINTNTGSNNNDNNRNSKDVGKINNELPPMYLQKEVNSLWDQIGTTLEGIEDSEWICFQNVLVVKDTFSGGGRVVKTPPDAENFRNKAYEMHEMPSPPPVQARKEGKWSPKITVFHKSTNRRIVNEAALLRMLRQFSGGSIRVVEFTFDTPFKDQLEIMASTDILVSTHTSALANLAFLPRGAVVLELIHKNWVWSNLDTSFKAQSDARGDLYHWAWRAVKKEHGKYINPRDEQRFGGDEWAGDKCDTDDCVEAHTNIDVIVDIEAVEKLLVERLPLIQESKQSNNRTAVNFPWPPP
ncbi:hypothetical protein Ndes2526B_g02863 [Nannochloris sp. 'desiccata']|nr:putative EGF domain-specific O-linked N-acetylglucosamine transferase [Chlorella desiccata (nom. nud.)]